MTRTHFDEDHLHRACEVLCHCSQELDAIVAEEDLAMMERMSQVYALDQPRNTDDDRDERLWANVPIMQNALADTTSEGLDRALHVLGPIADRTCDVETLHRVLARRVNPFAMHAVETALVVGSGLRSMSATTIGDAGPTLRMHLCLVPRLRAPLRLPWDHAEVQLAPSIWWDGRDLVMPAGLLPDTIMAAAAGRRLADVIRQPTLDLLGLHISSTSQRGTTVTLLTDREVSPVTWWEAREAMKGRSA